MTKLDIHSASNNNFIRLNVIKNKPLLRIDNKGLSFSKEAYLQLDNTLYIKVLVDKKNKYVLLKKGTESDPCSIYYSGDENKHLHTPKLYNLLSKWININHDDCSYNIEGTLYPSLKGVLFDAKDFVRLQHKQEQK